MKISALRFAIVFGTCCLLGWTSPADARFLQADPVGYDDQFNLYTYVGNDPVNNIDPTGKDCISSNGVTRCITSNYNVSFPTQRGWQDFRSADPNYHSYSTPARSSWSQQETRQWVTNNPTPGFPSPASPSGTINDATPYTGGLLPTNLNPVASFSTVNQANDQPVVVNVTLPGHWLQSGIVVRQVDAGPDGTSLIQNWGEGNSPLQAPGSRFAETINGVWADERPPEGPSRERIHFCQRHPGANC